MCPHMQTHTVCAQHQGTLAGGLGATWLLFSLLALGNLAQVELVDQKVEGVCVGGGLTLQE